jgi:hypothetical protein
MIHSAVGCGVTLQCRILRRWCSMTKKQYSIRNVTVGTVKKSKWNADPESTLVYGFAQQNKARPENR